MRQLPRLVATLVPALGVLTLNPALAQTVEYDVTVIGEAPGAYITYTDGLNDHGTVVGTLMFIPGGLKAYTWTTSQGFTILPQPGGLSDYGAVDINNSGVIGGDGGGDGGQIWRYTSGTYEMLGVLPGTAIPRAEAINSLGGIVGTCLGTLFYNPHHSFFAEPGQPMSNILSHSWAYDINDSNQIAGGAPLSEAYRYTPGVGVELLPPLGSRIYMTAYGINNGGKVVGVAASSAEHSNVPFIFSDATGIQEIGAFGGRAFASHINDNDEVVGSYEPGSGNRKAWVWSASQGVRFLNDVIDPAPGAYVHYIRGFNNVGQILCEGSIPGNSFVPMLLTPRIVPPTSYCDPPSANSVSAGGAILSHVSGQPGGLMTLQIDAVPTTPGILFYGTTRVSLPLGCGQRCAGGSLRRSGVYQPTTTSFQALLNTSGAAPGQMNLQYWFRDGANFAACGDVFNLSNALEYQ